MPIRAARGAANGEEGTASVELVAVVPFLLLAVLMVAQLALAGQALWSAGVAARAGARAALVSGDAEVAARQALPPALRRGAEVEETAGVSVRVAVPRLLPQMPMLRLGVRTVLGPDG